MLKAKIINCLIVVAGSQLFYQGAFAELKTLAIKMEIANQKKLTSIVIPAKGSILLQKEVWRSKSGISCTANLFNVEEPKAQFDCIAPTNHRAQVSVDCTKNNTEANPVYLFFGLVGSKGDNMNFFLWCE